MTMLYKQEARQRQTRGLKKEIVSVYSGKDMGRIVGCVWDILKLPFLFVLITNTQKQLLSDLFCRY